MSGYGRKPEETGKRPEPGRLEPVWSYLSLSTGAEYSFEMYQADGSDSLYFVDPRDDPQPWELRDGSNDLGLDREQMTEMRDLFTYLLDNWGRPWARRSHPEPEEEK